MGLGLRTGTTIGRGSRLAALGALALVAVGCVHRGTAEAPVVTELGLVGVNAVDADALRRLLATRAAGRFSWGDDVRLLDRDALEVDRQRIVAFYRERGYYRAEVEEPEVTPAGKGQVKVVLRVREGSPVRVTRLEIAGLDGAPAAREKAGELPLRVGHVFTWAAYDASRAQLQAALVHAGYATATVTPSAVVHAADGAAEVTFRVEAGPRYRFGPVSVEGTAAIPPAKVAARAAAQVTPGEWYDERRLERARVRVLELGVFSGVRVSEGTPDPAAGAVPTVVTVREAPFHTVRAGPSLGIDPSRIAVVGQASWTNRNWLGDPRRLRLDARGGYAWIPNPVSPIREGWVGTVSAELAQPGVLGDRLDLTIRAELEKSLEQAYGAVAEKLRLGTPFRPAPGWTLVPSYNLEFYALQDLAGDPSALPLQNCPSQFCVLSYLEQRVTWDGRDHPLLTTAGWYLSLALQEGFPAGGLGYTYVRVLPEARWFTPLGGGSVLGVRARVGAIVPLRESGPAPIVALFTAGGGSSMRGYGAERLSPMTYQQSEWVPIGGNGMIEGSLEVRRSLGGSVVGALFLDAGNVSSPTGRPTGFVEVLDLSRLQWALGVGLRYQASVGSLRVDLAVRLPDDLGAGVPFAERFPAVPGTSGHREPIAVLHVALGEAY